MALDMLVIYGIAMFVAAIPAWAIGVYKEGVVFGLLAILFGVVGGFFAGMLAAAILTQSTEQLVRAIGTGFWYSLTGASVALWLGRKKLKQKLDDGHREIVRNNWRWPSRTSSSSSLERAEDQKRLRASNKQTQDRQKLNDDQWLGRRKLKQKLDDGHREIVRNTSRTSSSSSLDRAEDQKRLRASNKQTQDRQKSDYDHNQVAQDDKQAREQRELLSGESKMEPPSDSGRDLGDMMDDDLYAIAWEEVEKGIQDRGLWARFFVENDADEGKTKVAYIKARVKLLVQKRKQEFEKKKRLEEELAEKVPVAESGAGQATEEQSEEEK